MRSGGWLCGAGSKRTGITKGETWSGDVPRGFKLSGRSGRRPGSLSGCAGLVVRVAAGATTPPGKRWWWTDLFIGPGRQGLGRGKERDAGEERRGLKSGEGRAFKHLRGPLERKGAGDLGP